ncbi:MAG: DUF4286 family protein [Bacteroidetes bacterium]|nr:MAG: DUF4286 family protein [Bacteroidota bacterium]
MLIYEVNLHVHPDAAEALAAWLPPHIRQMLGFEGFLAATWLRRTDAGDDRVHWTIRYHVAGRAHLDAYLTHHAAAMRAEGLRRFGDAFTADRRILDHVASFDALPESP